ncbi:hypothetical protein JCM15519_14930 [Fundidesulfovibrio butyratiphilus]
MYKAAQAYMQTQVTTTTQGDLLIMLFDACIKFLKQAKERITARDFANKGVLISKALDIIAELQSSLNPQKGGDLADNLSKLYLLCSSKLLMANLHMDLNQIDQVIDMLGGIRDAFAQINTPELSPQAPTPVQTSRFTGTGATLATMPKPAPSATPNHKAFAAYAMAGKNRAVG